MKKIVFVALAMMTAVCGGTAGEQTGIQTEKSAGNVVKETRQVGEFNGITLIGSCKVICTLGEKRGGGSPEGGRAAAGDGGAARRCA